MKKIVIGFIIGAITFSGIGVLAANYLAKDIPYNKHGQATVEDALNDLYGKTSSVSSDVSSFATNTSHSISLGDLLTSFNVYKDSTTMTKIINNSTYTNYILSHNDAIKILDISDPIISTDTSKVFYSSQYDNNWSAASAFGASGSGWTAGSGISYKDQYVGYDFGEAVWVYKIVTKVSNGKQNTDYVLEGSNDKTDNYVVIKDGLHQEGDGVLVGTEKTIIPNNYHTKYRYYRIRFLSDVAQSGSGNTVLNYLRFYAKK